MSDAGAAMPGPGEHVGGYEIEAVLDAGGASAVCRALQRQPIQRRVALKISRADAASGSRGASSLAREQRILARLRDEHVVQVFDAGTDSAGWDYLAMELVEGAPIDVHCRRRRLGERGIVALFRQACEAVRQVHYKSIVHRDLRAAHLLVAEREDAAVVKLTGFGRARALDEAAGGTEGDERGGLDIRSDVQALGALLESLLVSSAPLGDAMAQAAEAGASGPHRRPLRGDLACIVRRATAADPGARYPSVAEFDADLGRYLADEPVHANPAGSGYRLGKFVRRHRLLSVVALVLLVALVGTPIGYGVGLARAVERQERFDRLATVARLETAKGRRAAFLAAPPDALVAEELGTWLAGEVAQLRADLLGVRAALGELRARAPVGSPGVEAAPAGPADRLAELERLRARLEVLRRAESVAAGRLEPEVVELSAEDRARRLVERLDEAKSLLEPGRQVFGKEARGLALARSVAEEEGPEYLAAQLYWVLVARGLLATGRPGAAGDELQARIAQTTSAERDGFGAFADAVEAVPGAAELREIAGSLRGGRLSDREIEAAMHRIVCFLLPSLPGDQAAALRARLQLPRLLRARRMWLRFEFDRLEEDIAGLPAEIEDLEARIARLADEVVPRTFADESERFLHDRLSRVLPELEEFLAEQVPALEQRRRWAEGIEGWTLAHPHAGATWDEARAAIAMADGITAHEAYAEVPLELEPQRGLVPIGMNPVTRLWEFYHLRSAWDPERGIDPAELAIPRHAADGGIDVEEDTGIVFVLIPGGTGLFNAQSHDPDGPNFDPWAEPSSRPQTMPVPPYFIARHELTQGQWLRLSGALHPCFSGPGSLTGEPAPADLRHPVERVSWLQADALLRSWGLIMPQRSWWDFAARARQSGAWYFGSEVGDLPRYENVGDACYVRGIQGVGFGAGREVPSFDDGYYDHAPVGRFLPNPFGLYDVCGNVCEWTMTPAQRPRPGEPPTSYWICGGNSQSAPEEARLVLVDRASTDYTMGTIAVRAAREVK